MPEAIEAVPTDCGPLRVNRRVPHETPSGAPRPAARTGAIRPPASPGNGSYHLVCLAGRGAPLHLRVRHPATADHERVRSRCRSRTPPGSGRSRRICAPRLGAGTRHPARGTNDANRRHRCREGEFRQAGRPGLHRPVAGRVPRTRSDTSVLKSADASALLPNPGPGADRDVRFASFEPGHPVLATQRNHQIRGITMKSLQAGHDPKPCN